MLNDVLLGSLRETDQVDYTDGGALCASQMSNTFRITVCVFSILYHSILLKHIL